MQAADSEVPFDDDLPGYPIAYHAGARRLDAGGRPNPILLPMVEHSLSMVLEWSPENVAAALSKLTTRTISKT
eukprot:6315365-Amphidinium_carterae.1